MAWPASTSPKARMASINRRRLIRLIVAAGGACLLAGCVWVFKLLMSAADQPQGRLQKPGTSFETKQARHMISDSDAHGPLETGTQHRLRRAHPYAQSILLMCSDTENATSSTAGKPDCQPDMWVLMVCLNRFLFLSRLKAAHNT
jgi:hypothetical protein